MKNGAKLAIANIDSSRKAAISVSIDKGHFHAQEYPEGLAHLLEHMLFNASEKYPDSSALDDHLAMHHGHANAWTQDTKMCFQFNCDPSGVLTACNILFDRLSQPLFRLADIQKELNAIDAEFKLKIDDPVSRLLAVQKALSNPGHPFSRFSTGNHNTFKAYSLEALQLMLQAFHQYSVQGKHICISIVLPEHALANEDIEKLSHIIEGALDKEPIDAFSKSHMSNISPMFLPENMNSIVHIKQAQGYQLMQSFILRNISLQTADSLLVLLTHISQSKHEGGLYDLLLQKNWINNLHCYYKHLEANTYELCVSVDLTIQGANEHGLLSAYITQFFAFLSSTGIEKWRLREKAKQYNLQAALNKHTSALERALTLTHKMHTHAFEDCLLEDTYNVNNTFDILPSVLKQLNSKQAQVFLISPLAKTNKRAPHYEVEYAVQSTSLSELASQNIGLRYKLPRANPFMMGENKLITQEIDALRVYPIRSSKVNLKFYQDTQFQLANGECYISITDPKMYETTKQIAIKRVWLACLNEYLSAKFFDVEYASLHFRVYPHHHGISIHTSGLSEKQLLLCLEIINTIKTFKASEVLVDKHLHRCITRLRRNLQQKPFNQLFGYLNEYYADAYKSNRAVLSCMENLSFSDINRCQMTYFAHNYIESLLIGNWQTGEIKRFFSLVNSRFNNLSSVIKPQKTTSALKQGEHIHMTIKGFENENLIWHAIPLVTDKNNKLELAARSLVLEKLLAPIAFEILRQQHQMGYMLGVGYKPIDNFPGIALYLQSPSHSIANIFTAMQEVIKTGIQLLNDDNSMLEHLVKELCKQVTPKEKELAQRANRAWLHFDDEHPLLAYKDLVNALRAVSIEDLQHCLQTMLNSSIGQTVLSQNAFQRAEQPNKEVFERYLGVDEPR